MKNSSRNTNLSQFSPILNLFVTKFKTHIQKTKIMASGPITSWQIDRKTMEIVTDYFGEMVTAAMKLSVCFLEGNV